MWWSHFCKIKITCREKVWRDLDWNVISRGLEFGLNRRRLFTLHLWYFRFLFTTNLCYFVIQKLWRFKRFKTELMAAQPKSHFFAAPFYEGICLSHIYKSIFWTLGIFFLGEHEHGLCYKLFLVFHRLIFLELVNIHIGWI